MTSDDKDKSKAASGGDDAKGSSKRPSRVIDLEAKEVEADDPALESGVDEPGKAADDDAATAATDATAAGDERKPGKTDTRPPPPPQRTGPSEIKGFVTHLAAGLIGGLVGVIGAGVALDKLPLAGLLGKAGAPEQTSALERRLDALDKKITSQLAAQPATQASALEGVARADKVAALEVRLAGLENKPDGALKVPDSFSQRVDKLEDTLKTLGDAAGEEGASGLELSAALTAKIDGVSAALETRSGALGTQVAALKKELEALGARQPSGGEAVTEEVTKALAARLESVEGKITTLSATRAKASAQTPAATAIGGKGAGLALAFESLRRAVESGQAYRARLDALAALAPAGVDLSALEKRAGKGVETRRALLLALPPFLSKARLAASKSVDDTLLDRLVSNAQSVLRVRRVGPATGESAASVLSRMEAHSGTGDLMAILREAEALGGPARDQMQPWLARANAHAASRAALIRLEKGLIESLKPGAEAQR